MQLQRASGRQLARQLFGRDEQRVLALLRAAWPAAVGLELARRTEVVTLEGRTLRVRVPDAGWRKVLHRLRGDILQRLQETAGSLAPERLGFVEAPLGVPLDAPPPSPASPGQEPLAPRPLASAVSAAAAEIRDPEIRERFLDTARRYLGRTRPKEEEESPR